MQAGQQTSAAIIPAETLSAAGTIPLQAAPHDLTARRPPLLALTGIRIFAAYYVFIFHTQAAAVAGQHGLHRLSYLIGNGFLAVPLFFVLSGFILAYTYHSQIRRPGDHRRFWEARFARIWPVYALSLLLATIPTFKLPPWPSALAALLMVQAWNPLDLHLAGVWNPVCWTLSVEAVFYLVFPWVQTWLERRSPRLQLALILLMLAADIAMNSGTRRVGYAAEGLFSFIPLPLPHLPEFFAGVGLGNLFLARKARPSLSTRSSSQAGPLAGRGMLTYAALALTLLLLTLPEGRWSTLVMLGFAPLVYGLAAENTLVSRLLSTPLMLLGGGISYSLYLMQVPVHDAVDALSDRLHVGSSAARFGVSLVLLTGVSVILFKAVEEPARKLLRGSFATLEERRAAGAARRSAH